MSDDAANGKTEIVIIRRRSGDDGAAVKGGAWKIAYADFVTAMMAFFLVMWLINASNEATRSQVASYFNPIKLTDSSTGDRGLNDPKVALKKKPGSSLPEGKPKEEIRGEDPETTLLADPEAALDRIMAEAAGKKPGNKHEEAGSQSNRPTDSLAPGIGDPFDPRSWEAVPRADEGPATGPKPTPDQQPVAAETTKAPAEPPVEPAPQESATSHETVKSAPVNAVVNKVAEEPLQVSAQNAKGSQPDVESIEREILEHLGKTKDELETSLDVTRMPEGVLVSLADRHVFGMFRSGSAEPEPKLVELMAAIAAALQEHQGHLVIRGHTDSTPYRNRRYDNWQLSTARAHMAQYMLIRGGLDEGRIARVEGVADRQPRRPDDPAAAENRRIDILLSDKP